GGGERWKRRGRGATVKNQATITTSSVRQSRHAVCSTNHDTKARTSAKPRLPDTRPRSARSVSPTVVAPIAPGSASRAPSVNTPSAQSETGSPRKLPHLLDSTVSQLTTPPRLQKLV